MELTQTILTAAVVPGLVAGLFLIPWQPWTRAEPPRWVHSVAAIGIVVGFGVAHYVLEGLPEFPPVDAGRWVIFIGIASLAVVFFPGFSDWNVFGRVFCRFAILALTLALVWGPLIGETWTPTQSTFQVLITLALGLLTWEILDRSAKTRAGGSLPAVLFVALSAICVITILDGALKYGVLIAALASTQASAAVVGFWGRRYRAQGIQLYALMTLVFAMLASAHAWAYFEETYDRFLLYFVALIGAGVVDLIPPLARAPSWKREALRLTLVLAPLVAALVLSLAGQDTDTGPYYY